MARVDRAVFPTLPADRQLQLLLGRSLFECLDLLEVPWGECDPVSFNGKIQTIRAVMYAATKLGIEGSRQSAADRDKALKVLGEALRDG